MERESFLKHNMLKIDLKGKKTEEKIDAERLVKRLLHLYSLEIRSTNENVELIHICDGKKL